MKEWLKDDVFKTLTATHERLWESLSTVIPRFPTLESTDLWRETYLNNLLLWENAVKHTLDAESTLIEQWTKQVGSQHNVPAPLSEWMQQVEEVMRQWIQTQTDLWDECFRILKSSGEFAQPLAEQEVTETESSEETTTQTESIKEASVAKPVDVVSQSPDKDDLKMISGLGPALEKKLNAYGITSYRQIAGLTEEQINHIETSVIRLSGRIHRDKWIEQAKQLHFKKYHERL